MRNNILRVLWTNILNLSIGIISGLLIPAFLSINQYAYLKTFTLYISYIGILHFGFTDGLFLKYGGQYKEELNQSTLLAEHRFFLRFQLIISIIIGVLALVYGDIIIATISISIIPYNTITFFKSYYQAIGDFKLYSRTIVISPLILLILNIILITVIKVDNYLLFVGSNIFAQFIVFLFLEMAFYRGKSKVKVYTNKIETLMLFKSGFLIMIGNLSAMMFFEIDRWFVKVFLSLEDFATYSFAASMMSMIMIFINSITAVFYPFLSRNKDKEMHIELKHYLILLGSLASISYFVFAFIVNIFIPKYIDSLKIIAVIFVVFPEIIVIRALYVNLYKVEKKDKIYSKTVAFMLLMSVVLNFGFIYIFGNNLSVAIATAISFVIWYIFSTYHFNWLKSGKKELMYLISFTILFTITTNMSNYLMGFTVNIILTACLIYFLYKKEMVSLVLFLKNGNLRVRPKK